MDKKTEKELCLIVERNYNEIAEHFSETRKKFLWPELIKLTQGVKDGDRVLDVGCGNGRLLEALKNKRVEYLGVDACSRLVDIAKKDKPDFKFMVGDALSLGKVPELGFDYVFSVAVLQHIPGKRLRLDAFRQMRNKIKPGGKIVISVWNMWSREWSKRYKFRYLVFKFFLLKLIGKNKMDFGDVFWDWKAPSGEAVSKRYYHALTKRELKKYARTAGLKIQKIYKDKYNYYLVASK